MNTQNGDLNRRLARPQLQTPAGFAVLPAHFALGAQGVLYERAFRKAVALAALRRIYRTNTENVRWN